MKKRKLALVFVLIVALFASQATAFASDLNLLYNEVSAVEDYINYSGGTLYFGVSVLVPDRDTLDYVIINADLKTAGGAFIRSFNKRLAYANGEFDYNRSYVPEQNGLYFLEYTVKCYKNGKLVDEISKYTKREYVKIN